MQEKSDFPKHLRSAETSSKEKNRDNELRCSRCVYPESIPLIEFDDQGVCSFCRLHERLDLEHPTGVEGQQVLEQMASTIREAGRGKPYDCVVGVSGGCDSSYLLYKAKELGLRPIAVHFDNTWNSTKATENIYNILKGLDVELYTHVVDNEEYDDIYRSFLSAGVPDLEIPTDIALAATLYGAAEKFGVKYILEGHSFRTEGIAPLGWIYMDGKYIESVQNQFGTKALKTFPNLKMYSFLKWVALRGIKKLRPLYYMDYHKAEAKKLLSEEFGWQWYGGHHLENRFTAFFHTYYWPKRFGIDGRLLGHAALVRSGQISREEALEQILTPQAYDPELLEYVVGRLGYSNKEFDSLMNAPLKTYRDYKTYKKIFELMRPLFWLLCKFDRVPKSFYLKYAFPDPVSEKEIYKPAI